MIRKTLLAAALLFSSQALASQDVIIPVGVHTTTNVSPDQIRTQEIKAHFIINVTVVPGSGATVTPEIDAKDYLGNYYPLIIGTAISSTGVTVLKIGPGLGQIPSNAAADYLPDVYRIKMTHSTTTSFTYGVTINRGP